MMMRHAAGVAAERGATHLGVHWRKADRNEPAAAFLFSLPGVRFAPAETEAGVAALGLGALDRETLEAGAEEAGGGEAVPPLPPPVLARPAAVDLEDAAAVEGAVELAVASAVDAGRRPTLVDLPPLSALECVPAAARRQLMRRLKSRVAKARGGELARPAARLEVGLLLRGRVGGELCRRGAGCAQAGCPFVHPEGWTEPPPTSKEEQAAAAAAAAAADATRPGGRPRDPTYGQISQYRKFERPEAGVVLIPVESAAAAAVSFASPLASAASAATARQPQPQPDASAAAPLPSAEQSPPPPPPPQWTSTG